MKARAKRLLVRTGATLPDWVTTGLNATVNYLTVGSWLKRNGLTPERTFDTRLQLFDHMAVAIRDEAVHYMEFGVAAGDSLRYWTGLLANERSRLHGFDSFEGLPTSWGKNHPRGRFDAGGTLPAFDDGRVALFKGWFEETLPVYDWSGIEYERLVLNLDADLYASTDLALKTVESRICPGTMLYFDEFNHQADELRAFAELLDRHPGLRFRTVGATRDYVHITFECVAAEQPG